MHFCSSPGNISILFQVLMVLAYNNHDNTCMLHHQTKTLISIKKRSDMYIGYVWFPILIKSTQ